MDATSLYITLERPKKRVVGTDREKQLAIGPGKPNLTHPCGAADAGTRSLLPHFISPVAHPFIHPHVCTLLHAYASIHALLCCRLSPKEALVRWVPNPTHSPLLPRRGHSACTLVHHNHINIGVGE